MIDDDQKNKLLDHLQEVEENVDAKDIYVGFNGHGHLRYIQATREGLIKLGIFMIKSAFSHEKYINMDSDDETLEWIDPEETEPIDYIHIIEDEKELPPRNKDEDDTKISRQDWIAFIFELILIGIILAIVTTFAVGVITIIQYIISLF